MDAQDAPAPGDRIRQWVLELASDQFQVREEATEALRVAGEAAREALEKAAASEDPEVRHRASTLLAGLDRRVRQVPAARPKSGDAPPDAGFSVRAESVSIQEGPDSVRVEVTVRKDGKSSKEVYEASDRAQFQKKHPEIYEKYLGGQEEDFRGRFLLRLPGLDAPIDRESDREFDRLRRNLDETRRTRKPRLGVETGPLPEVLAHHLRLDRGLLVGRVVPGTPAEKAGIRAMDILLSFGGAKIGDAEDLADAVSGAKAGQPIAVGLIREGKPVGLKVVLEEEHR